MRARQGRQVDDTEGGGCGKARTSPHNDHAALLDDDHSATWQAPGSALRRVGYWVSPCAGDSTAVCCSSASFGCVGSAAGVDSTDSGEAGEAGEARDSVRASGASSTACSCPSSSATGSSMTMALTAFSITVACPAVAAILPSPSADWPDSSTGSTGAERSCALHCPSASAAAWEAWPVASATGSATVLSVAALASTRVSVQAVGVLMTDEGVAMGGGAVDWMGSSASSPGVARTGSPAVGGIAGSAAPVGAGSAASLLTSGSGRWPRSRPNTRLMVSSTLLICSCSCSRANSLVVHCERAWPRGVALCLPRAPMRARPAMPHMHAVSLPVYPGATESCQWSCPACRTCLAATAEALALQPGAAVHFRFCIADLSAGVSASLSVLPAGTPRGGYIPDPRPAHQASPRTPRG
jgi:hypothetical protein